MKKFIHLGQKDGVAQVKTHPYGYGSVFVGTSSPSHKRKGGTKFKGDSNESPFFKSQFVASPAISSCYDS